MDTTMTKSLSKSIQAQLIVTRQSKFWNSLEFNRFGLIPLLLLIVGCIGGIAAAYGAQASILKLSMIAFPTIISLAMVLAVAPMRIIAFVSAIAILLDVAVFLF
jgi:hypothetical protein